LHSYTYNDLATCLRLSALCGFNKVQVWNSSRDSWILPSCLKINAEKKNNTKNWFQKPFLCQKKKLFNWKSQICCDYKNPYFMMMTVFVRLLHWYFVFLMVTPLIWEMIFYTSNDIKMIKMSRAGVVFINRSK
jgi:hypothetical protein